MRRTALAVALLALVAVPVARASEDHPTSLEVQEELYCDDCQTTLADASSVSWTPAAISQIHKMVAKGFKKSQIKQTLAKKYYGHLEVLPAKPKAQSNRPTLADLEGEVMCPVCNTTLDQSSSPAARQIEAFISARIAAGDSKNEIKDRLVAEYGASILAAPPKKGFNLLAWLLPFVALFGGALVLALLAWRWSNTREPGPPAAPLSPALERRVDEELARYDEG
jgi:cytochrome c-type biogenesis protein CcmH